MNRERETINTMIRIYCSGRHGKSGRDLCGQCEVLKAYANKRLDLCPFREHKTTCARCRVHCYTPEMRETVKQVMRYAGPKMTWQHPLLALLHFIDGFRSDQAG
jgi:hypothetical protein